MCVFTRTEEREGRREWVVFSAVPPLVGIGIPRARVNCRRFLVVQFFWSGDVSRCAPVSRVPCASTGLGSKFVCCIDEKVAWQSVVVMK